MAQQPKRQPYVTSVALRIVFTRLHTETGICTKFVNVSSYAYFVLQYRATNFKLFSSLISPRLFAQTKILNYSVTSVYATIVLYCEICVLAAASVKVAASWL
jgi:hypothetical protein